MKPGFPHMLAMIVLLPILSSGLCPADEDSDGDRIPDRVEETLGTNPDRPEELTLIHDDKSLTTGDTSIGEKNYRPSHDVMKVHFGNVAGNRFVWLVEFAAPIDQDDTCCHLYLDVDMDRETGRKDKSGVRGTDYMLTYIGKPGLSRFDAAGERIKDDAFFSMWVDGNKLYIVKDINLNQEGGKSFYRAYVLCHTLSDEDRSSDSTAWFDVRAAGVSDRAKSKMLTDFDENESVVARYGLRGIRTIMADEKNVVVRIGDCDLEGYIYDIFTSFFFPTVKRTAPLHGRGSVSTEVPVRGPYHPGFLMYDGSGKECIAIEIDGVRKGVAVGNKDNNRVWLYALSEAYDFAGTETLRLVIAGRYSSRDELSHLLFLKDKPQPRDVEFILSHIEARPLRDRPGEVSVTWISSWPCVSRVEFGETNQYGQIIDSDDVARGDLCSNHRVIITNLVENKPYHFRVVAVKPDGGKIMSPDQTFRIAFTEPTCRAERERLELTVKNELDVDYVRWPVTSGVPFPKGELGSEGQARLLDKEGKELPLQTRVLVRWPDSTVKWLLLDFQADVAANSQATYVLEYGRAVKRTTKASGVNVKETKEGIEICTGPTKILLDRKRFAVPGAVWLDQNGDGRFADDERVASTEASAIVVTDDAGVVYESHCAPDMMEVEDAGPMRATVRVKGSHKSGDGEDLFRYDVRIMAFAGRPYVRVFHTFGNDNVESEFTSVRNILLRTGTTIDSPRWTVGVESGASGGSGGSVRLFQNFDDKYSVTSDGKEIGNGQHAPGWIDLSGGKCGVTAAMRNFWQLYPKSLEAEGKRIIVGICPNLNAEDYAPFPFEKEQHKLFYYLLDGRYKFKSGIEKRHELLYWFHGTEWKPEESGCMSSCFNRPLLALAPAAWYCESKALYDMWPEDEERFELYEKSFEGAAESYVKRQEHDKAYGMLNLGDWYGERGCNWGNIEYDTQHSFLLHFVRSGRLKLFFLGEQAARHNIDVDTVHYAADPKRVGAVYCHCMGHVGRYYKVPPMPAGITGGGFSVTHTWTEGDLDYYYLTGDRRAFEIAKQIADRYDSQYTNLYDFTVCRTPGWHLILTLALYNATYDPCYLNAAHIIVERVLERQTPETGGWERQMVPGHCYCVPRHRGNAVFMVAILLSGMKYYHYFTGDERVAEAIVAGAKYMFDTAWVPETCGFRYTSCPRSSKGRGTTFLYLEGIAYAYRWSRNDLFKEIVLKGIGDKVGVGGMGKSLSSGYRCGPRALYDIAGMGVELKPAPPPKFVPPDWMKDGKCIVIQAEDLSAQGKGEVRVMTDRVATFGKMITYWHQDVGHWLEWKFKTTEKAKYRVILRYATATTGTRRDFRIDGAHPYAELKEIKFPATGGFSSTEDNWRYFTLADKGGKPLAFELSPGEHVIRMTNLNDGMGLDFIALVEE